MGPRAGLAALEIEKFLTHPKCQIPDCPPHIQVTVLSLMLPQVFS